MPEHGDTLPRAALPKRVLIDDIELWPDHMVGITPGKSGGVIRHWSDESKTVHLFLVMSAIPDDPSRAVFMFSLNGPVPTEVGESLCQAFLPDSVAYGITVAMMPGMPSGVMATNAAGPLSGVRIVPN
jgi:hypothetical protein